MPSRALHRLSYACLVLVAAYIALFATALFFASIRSSLSAELRERESAVAALETEYYDAISKLQGSDYVSAGFTSPVAVDYVAEGGDTAVTRLDR
jgi:hypothetical protein